MVAVLNEKPLEAVNADTIREAVESHLMSSLGKDAAHATRYDWRMALSLTLRDLIVSPWFQSTRRTYAEQRKRVYYLSMEFLIGRLIEDAIVNLGLEASAREALEAFGVDFRAVVEDEPDAALGNGGLGRLAACYAESMATLGVAGYGYGVRYEHGLFRQRFENGEQVEEAEDWLAQRHAWEFERPEVAFPIGFGGRVSADNGHAVWQPEERVIASAYDTPVIGWKGRWANTLRLWAAKPTKIFDLDSFNRGQYTAAAEPEALARTLSRVLYPDDTTAQGKELRLKQEYFFTAASVRDILRRFFDEYDDHRLLPQKIAVQLNDTHPAIAGPEMVRLLTDFRGVPMREAIETVHGCLAFTNHTLLPEALERWPLDLMWRVLPRHTQIIEQIERWHLENGGEVRIIEDDAVKMGELAFVTSHRVNGVSALHTDLVRQTVFSTLHRQHPGRIVNVTNGVTPRRWLCACNPDLRALIDEALGDDDWPGQLSRLEDLVPHVDDPAFLERYAGAKRRNKERLAAWIAERGGPALNPEALFDVQIKRIHEYKRQLLNILETIALYNQIRENPEADWTPRVKLFGGKAAPGYFRAKQIIHLINDVGARINADPVCEGRLAVVFPENYNVSMAELIIPAADLSEQISTAGKEASGTGNMKLALNGAPTIGTLDGANVEIRERVGEENFFLFGLTADEVPSRRAHHGYAREAIEATPALKRALHQVARGDFSPGEPERYRDLVGDLWDNDYFMVTVDFAPYFEAQRRVDDVFRDRAAWLRMAALNTARVGWFSSDRAVGEYADKIWGVEPAT